MNPLEAEFFSLLPAKAVDRRSFMVTSLGVGFALAVQPVMAQTAIVADDAGLVAGPVKIPVRGGEMIAYRALPQGAQKPPLILVVSEIFGVHEYIQDVCRRLAKKGYCAIAPELFARQGDPRQYSSIPDILAKITNRTPDAQVMADLDACVAWASAKGADTARLGITGFCWGGRITWLYAAHEPRLKAGVAWYGRLAGPANDVTPQHPVDVAARISAPVLGLYGGQDAGIPLDTIETMRKALAAAGKPGEIHVYPDAPHAFHADYRPSYRQDAAEDGWKRMLAWFAANGV
ncbi:MAG: dienelactone hydrolase family protein [Betaproteobacteria bacterium]|jgi:carboxymethylenebutenolidase|nr:dienelactone hydrolase family protein [Betaproteobacteria bacterium]